MTDVTLSIVIPFKNEMNSIETLFARLFPILKNLKIPFEVICVNDGSTDNTYFALLQQQRNLPEIVIVDLSRNFGKEAALTAGIEAASGEALIPLDADLQDPPELIPEMIEQWQNGAEVVLAIRTVRQTDSYFTRKSAGIFYWILNRVSEIDIPAHSGDFRLMNRQVIDTFLSLPERARFNKGLFAWLGFKTSVINFERPLRVSGSSNWSFKSLWSLAIDGITSFSSLPLRIWSYLGIIIALIAIGYGISVMLKVLVFGVQDVPGYASLMVTVLFSCGLNLIGLGVVAEYISRIFIEVKSRPLYVVRTIDRHKK
ncbi:glycosyltransferase family 2 protein [Amylibacter sp.]|jgi:polyisoprenyl-phosphate glycosyltransferase|nr:glycosyltransferase family 2 protein [Amylibacter sp.]